MTDLFDYAESLRRSPMFEAYSRWDALNPHFYPLFVRFANQLLDRGHRKLSTKLIFERIRWESMIKTVGEDYRLNNNYTSIYARRFMLEFPEHEGVFSLRELKAMSEYEIEEASQRGEE